ncbi:hypothetical protein Y032_0042g538 [Ancylostoma ceylanicum]|uniref:MADF domain-containing protein n=1 Tax=Ancylostoma ceylanicum TaxID=53326 RepID=A0A016UG10_9BILA|nr:hypothetical protein Y032_0042g538 [Ancylostoma ceylanicum]
MKALASNGSSVYYSYFSRIGRIAHSNSGNDVYRLPRHIDSHLLSSPLSPKSPHSSRPCGGGRRPSRSPRSPAKSADFQLVASQVPMSYPAKILLIKLVKQHEALWNTRSADYSRADIKTQAWEDISARMAANGFESKVGRLKVMWKNLRDQWKRNLSLKMPPEREWYFQKRINFLADTYEGGELAHCPHGPGGSPDIHEAPDDSLYDVKTDGYDDLENGFAIEGSSLMGDCSPVTIREAKSEMQEDGRPCGPTLVTVLEENAHRGRISSHRSSPAPAPTPTTTSSSAPPLKRLRMEARNEAASTPKQRENSNGSGTSSKYPQTDKQSAKTPKDASNGLARLSASGAKQQQPTDKFDKYAAFVATTLREMSEVEAKKRMKEMTMLLLEDLE